MAGKKKTMEGGSFGLVPYQPKYDKETVKNKTFNELYTKLTRSEDNLIRGNSSFFNKVLAKKNIFLNTQRFEQRLNHFLEILNYKLSQPDINVIIFKKLYNNFKDIYNKYNKYKDTQGNSLKILLEETKKKLDTQRNVFIELNQLKFKKNQITNPDPQNPNLRMNNNKKQKLEEYNIIYEKLIQEFDEWIGRDFFKNFRDNRKITRPVEEQDDLFSYIIPLANRIHGLGKIYSLPEYKDISKLESLRKKLGILKELYKAVFINSKIAINKANRYANKNRNLNNKYQNLIGTSNN